MMVSSKTATKYSQQGGAGAISKGLQYSGKSVLMIFN